MAAFSVMTAMVLSSAPSARAATYGHGVLTATATASVTVLAPRTLGAGQALAFPALSRPANGGGNTVTLDPGGAMSVAGPGDTALSGERSAVSGAFRIVGPADTVYALTQTLSFDRPGLRDVRAIAGPPAAGAPGLLPASGAQDLRYGATFKVDAATPAGRYAGTLWIVASYN
ncbi:MAG TPA: DUF4402 domain-containing protein [Phenylobacterium sp.]|uniref:DUF4402 domain-containing protein n=1 Tax=Phenylobacterium sp. TaxID=1871053 RepID=UPI002D65BDF1|nr:DUF4402 domain-containing protein [Phenylobacterium sp.]HZZ69426.1 DUF4402 domain-containing protein [Phenylobacterium sp.]